MARLPFCSLRPASAIATMALTAWATAQDPYVLPNEAPPGPWGSAYVMAGPSLVDVGELFLDDMKRLVPGSGLLELDLSGHRSSSGELVRPGACPDLGGERGPSSLPQR